MENIKTFDQLTEVEKNIVRNVIGWDGTHYTDPKTGCVIELVEGGYIVHAKAEGDTEVVAETPATEPAPTDVPVQATEPTAPEATDPSAPTTDVPPAPEVPSESQDTTAPTPETEVPAETPATDVPPTEPAEEKSFLGKVFGG